MKIFTRREAEETLARVVPLCEKLREVVLRMQDLARVWKRHQRGPFSPLGDQEVDLDYFRDLLSAFRCLRAIHQEGCLLKRIEPFLLDFPFEKEGRVVLLCWQEGEESIRYWHEKDAGFAGRRPIEDLGHEGTYLA